MTIFFLAIAAGFLTILAPCILPILPFLLGTSGGRSKLRPLMTIVGFVGTFSVVGAAFATAGTVLGISNDALRMVAVVLLLLFGAALLFDSLYDRLAAKIQPALARLGAGVGAEANRRTDAVSGLLVGASLGIIWTPCAGPILGSILTLASRTSDYVTTAILMFAYALGAGIPMGLIAYGGQTLRTKVLAVGKWHRTLNHVFGALVIATALLIFTGYDIVVQTWLLRYYPSGLTGTL